MSFLFFNDARSKLVVRGGCLVVRNGISQYPVSANNRIHVDSVSAEKRVYKFLSVAHLFITHVGASGAKIGLQHSAIK